MESINLGSKSECGPCNSTALAQDKEPSVSYPSVYLNGDAKEFAGLPDEGVMTVRYKVTRRSIEVTADKKRSSLSIDLLKILEAKSDEDDKSPSEVLDDLAKQVTEEDDDE
jgi:hypothetical protein